MLVLALPITFNMFTPLTAHAVTSDIIQLNFTNDAYSVTQGQPTNKFTVQTQNGDKVPETLDTSGTKLYVTSSSPTGEFSTDGSAKWEKTPTYTLDNGTANGSFYYRDKTAGFHTLTAIAMDSNGTMYSWTPASQVVTIVGVGDTQAPGGTITISTDTGDKFTRGTVTATLKTDEPIKISNEWAPTAGTSNTEFKKVHSDNGTFDVEIEDVAGNKTVLSYAITQIDRVNPVIQGVVEGGIYAGPVEFTVDEANLARIVVDDYETTDTTVAGEREHTIEVFDKAGNSTTVTFIIDMTAPALSHLIATQNPDGTYTLSVRTNDPSATVELLVDGIPLVTETIDGGTTWTAITDALLAETSHTFSAVTTDDAGNGPVVLSGTFTVPAVESEVLDTDTIRNLFTPFTVLGSGEDGSRPADNDPASETNETVLSMQTQSAGKGNEKSSSQSALGAVAPSAQGWIIFGLAWYWWLLILLAVIAAVWQIVAAMRRRATAETAS